MNSLVLPEPDFELSSKTGYTRRHWEAIADHLLEGSRRHSSPGHALVEFPSRRPQDLSDRLEGFARTFLLAAFRIAGSSGGSDDLIQWYSQALRHGVDDRGCERWPALRDHSQPTVEAAAIAVALHVSRAWLWDRLDEFTKSGIIRWFRTAHGTWCADNNHVLLGATISAFLVSVGAMPFGPDVEDPLARIEDWYVGDGWYSDGQGRRFDHYNSWAFHFYPLFICRMLPDRLAAHRELYRERLGMFLRGYQHLFSAGGSPLIQGRSLVYRWGVVAPFWMARLEGVEEISAGRTRRLCSGVLRHFIDAGVGRDGTLGLGWHRDYEGILQSYNAPGSPHWASKGFLGLLLPPEDPAWAETEEPLDLEQRDVSRVLSGPRWLVRSQRSDGIARVHNFGSDGHPQKDDGLYRHLAYSTSTAPVGHQDFRDNDITVPVENTVHRSLRSGSVHSGGGSLRRQLDAAGRRVVMDYALLLLEDFELRVARIDGLIGLPLRLTGYAVGGSREPHGESESGWAAVDSGAMTSSLRWLDSAEAVEPVATVRRAAGGNALGPCCAAPALELPPSAVNRIQLAYAVSLNGALPAPDEVRVRFSPDGAMVTYQRRDYLLRWPTEDIWPADGVNQGVYRVPLAAGSALPRKEPRCRAAIPHDRIFSSS